MLTWDECTPFKLSATFDPDDGGSAEDISVCVIDKNPPCTNCEDRLLETLVNIPLDPCTLEVEDGVIKVISPIRNVRLSEDILPGEAARAYVLDSDGRFEIRNGEPVEVQFIDDICSTLAFAGEVVPARMECEFTNDDNNCENKLWECLSCS